MKRRERKILGALLAAVLVVPGAALAGGLDVAPVLISLSADRPSAVLRVANRGDTERQYQVTLSAWTQSPQGQMVLEDSSALTYFPRMLTLAPGTERSIRIGLQGKPTDVEQSFRVFVEELPSEADAAAQQIAVLTRVGIPVFVQPVRTESKATIDGLAVAGGKVAFAFKNSGTVHVRPTSVRVTATDDQGAALFEELVPAWYVLARSERRYEVTVPSAVCAKIRQVRVIAAAQAETFEASQPAPRGACGP